jgi:hypothetical protein
LLTRNSFFRLNELVDDRSIIATSRINNDRTASVNDLAALRSRATSALAVSLYGASPKTQLLAEQ